MLQRVPHLAIALVLAICVAGVAWHWGSRSCGGADSYGYLSQADAWLSGTLVVTNASVAADPPRFSRWAFSSLGWRPAVDGYASVPLYSPGYPLMLAAAKWVGGQKALFVVVPCCAGLLVFMTYALARALGRPLIGLLAAAIVAFSPSVIYSSMVPMSDTPSAALWITVIVMTLCASRRSAAGGGLAAALAILIRPNLLPLAALCGAWTIVDDVQSHGLRHSWRGRAVWFGALAAIGAIANAVINNRLFGSPSQSGYGDLSTLFSSSHFVPNLQRYAEFLTSAETPVALLALLATVLAPLFVRWNPRARRASWLLAAVVVVVVSIYLFYLEFDAWWYLRFLLVLWPVWAITIAIALAAVWRRNHLWGGAVASLVCVGMFAHGVHFMLTHEAFTIGTFESRYPQVARIVASVTDPDAVILSMQHSGSMRYYGGRLTARWDSIDSDQFDAAIAWFQAHGHKPYLLLDAFEVRDFRARYQGQSAFAALDWSARYSFFHGETMLFDIADRGQLFNTTNLGVYTNKVISPAPQKRW